MINSRVSVLVTFYNQEEFVDKALESILCQKTDFGIKILVGDDGSSDRTCEIVRDWINRYPEIIELYIMERDGEKVVPGFRASRNRLNLLSHVNTEYFIYLDGDDYFDYDMKLQRQVDILDKEENCDCIACGHNIIKQFSDGSRIPAMTITLEEGKICAKKYWKNMYFHTDTLLIRSSVIDKIDVDLLENNFNDNMITYSIIQFGSLYYLPENWAVYMQTGHGIWTEGKKVINSIRNIIICDLCLNINSSLKNQTKIRFCRDWINIYKLRHSINPDELVLLSNEAEKHGFKNSYRWIHYSELGFIEKMSLLFAFVSVLFIKTLSKVFKLF